MRWVRMNWNKAKELKTSIRNKNKQLIIIKHLSKQAKKLKSD